MLRSGVLECVWERDREGDREWREVGGYYRVRGEGVDKELVCVC